MRGTIRVWRVDIPTLATSRIETIYFRTWLRKRLPAANERGSDNASKRNQGSSLASRNYRYRMGVDRFPDQCYITKIACRDVDQNTAAVCGQGSCQTIVRLQVHHNITL